MTPRPMPRRQKGWQEWPTLDQLRERHPEIKLHALRAKLRSVACYKCDDNTVRYRPQDADAALAGESPGVDDTDESGDDSQLFDTLSSLPTPAVVLVLREFRKMADDRDRAHRELIKSMGDTIKTMAEPLRLGIELTNQHTTRADDRLLKHEESHDKLVRTHDDLITHQQQRQLEAEREQQITRFRDEGMSFLKEHAGTAIAKWQLNQQATAALGFLRRLDPSVVQMAVRQGWVQPAELDLLRQVRDDLSDVTSEQQPQQQ